MRFICVVLGPCLKAIPVTLPPSTVNVRVIPPNAIGRKVVLSIAINGWGWRVNPPTINLPSWTVIVASGPGSPLYLPAYDWSIAASTCIGGSADHFLHISLIAEFFFSVGTVRE